MDRKGKLQLHAQSRRTHAWRTPILHAMLQVEALKHDSSKLVAENSELRSQIIRANEGLQQHDKDAYQATKKLEDRIAELTYWKQTAADKMQAAERENSALLSKIAGLVALTDQMSSGAQKHGKLVQGLCML